MRHAGNEWGGIGPGDRIGAARRTADVRAGGPIMSVGIGQSGIDQFERVAETVMRREPFPSRMAVGSEAVRGEDARGPIALAIIGHTIDRNPGIVIELERVAAEWAG